MTLDKETAVWLHNHAKFKIGRCEWIILNSTDNYKVEGARFALKMWKRIAPEFEPTEEESK